MNKGHFKFLLTQKFKGGTKIHLFEYAVKYENFNAIYLSFGAIYLSFGAKY